MNITFNNPFEQIALIFLIIFFVVILAFIVYEYPKDQRCNTLILKAILNDYNTTEEDNTFIREKCDPIL